MCALCGVLGGSDHWTDQAARPGLYSRNVDDLSRRRERTRRVALANRALKPLGMSLSDWQGSSYLLSTMTGKTEVVDNLAHLWPSAERLVGRPCDPLEPGYVARIEATRG